MSNFTKQNHIDMKCIKIFFVLLLLMGSAVSVSAMTSQGSGGTYLKKKSGDNRTKRPDAPDRQLISCYCNDGLLTVTFAFPEGECVAYITDDNSGVVSTYSFDSSNLIAEIEIGDTQDFHIEITTERGATYVEASAFDAD